MLVFLQIAFQGVHYLSLTAFEFSAFLLAFTWLIRLFNHLEQLIVTDKKIVHLTIE